MENILKSKIERIKQDYCFLYNTKLTDKLSEIMDFSVEYIFKCEDRIFFSQKYPCKTILVLDTNYNLIKKYTIENINNLHVYNIYRYKGNYIVCDFSGEHSHYFDPDFNYLGIPPDPLGKKKNILSVVEDDKGGLYCTVKNSGTLYYFDKNQNEFSYQSDFRLGLSMAFFNRTLYILDLLENITLKKAYNIIKFKNGEFIKSNLTGDSICYSDELKCFFISNLIIEKSIRKYNLNDEMVFYKNFETDNKNISPFCVVANRNNLIFINTYTGKPVVYDIY